MCFLLLINISYFLELQVTKALSTSDERDDIFIVLTEAIVNFDQLILQNLKTHNGV